MNELDFEAANVRRNQKPQNERIKLQSKYLLPNNSKELNELDYKQLLQASAMKSQFQKYGNSFLLGFPFPFLVNALEDVKKPIPTLYGGKK